MIISQIIYNLSVLVALSILSGFLKTRYKGSVRGLIFQGLLFGCVAIIGMLFPFVLEKGIIFDGRSIVISLCTLFFGPVSGAIAALMAMGYRIYLSGIGAVMGSLVILESFLIGFLFNNLREKGKFKTSNLGLYLFGILVSAVMTALILTLPSNQRIEVFTQITFSVMVVYPIITLIIGKIFVDQENSRTFLANLHLEKTLYKTTLYSIGDAVITTDDHGNVNQMNPVAEALTGWKESEAAGKPLQAVFHIINEFSREKVDSPVDTVLSQGLTVDLANHTILISKEGKEVPIADSGAPIINEEGEITGVVLVFRDQTKERASRSILQESEKKYRYLFQNNPQPMWIYDLETLKFLEVNEAAIDYYGYSNEEFLNLTLFDIRLPEDIPGLIQSVKTNQGSLRKVGNWKHRKKNGEVIHVSLVTHDIDYEGKKARLVLISDITEQVHSQSSLKESEERYRRLVEYSPDAIAVHRNGKFLYVNPAGIKLIGAKNEEELLKLNILDIIHPDYIEAVKTRIREAAEKGHEQPIAEEKFIRMDGTPVDVEVLSTIVTLNGSPAVQVIARDITDRKKAQDELLKFRLGAEYSDEIIFITKQSGDIIYVNPAFEKTYGFSKEEAIGQTPRILKSGKIPQETYSEFWNTLISGNNISGELINKTKDGKFLVVYSSVNPIINERNEILGYLAVQRDVTEHHRMQEELVREKERAEEMNRLKTNFLANMSHEIRTPMIGILGYAEILKEEEDISEIKQMAATIHASGERLMRTLNQILDLSSIESNKHQLLLTEVNIAKTAYECINFYKGYALKENLTLDVVIKAENVLAWTDERMVTQILDNLVHNAIKFTKEGGVTLEVDKERAGEKDYAVIRVKDTGIGLSEGDQQIIFEEFRQASEGYNRSYQGTGLGLTITKKFIKLLGGEICVNSEPAKGSTFTLRIPSGVADKKFNLNDYD